MADTEGKPAASHMTGHRNRLRQRFINAGVDGVQDYELLELLLFRSIPRRDVKPLAKELIEQFGSFADVLAAAPERLTEIKGISEKVVTDLKVVQAAALKMTQQNILTRHVLSSWKALVEYCLLSPPMRKSSSSVFCF